MNLAQLLALFPDNMEGEISAADLRTAISELYVPRTMGNVVNLGPFSALPASPTFRSLPPPGPVSTTASIDEPVVALFILSVYIDTAGNNNDVRLALDFSGGLVEAAGSQPERVIEVSGKSAVGSTVSISFIDSLPTGATTAEVKYQASQSGASISNIALAGVSV
jgi:hypothetical protein